MNTRLKNRENTSDHLIRCFIAIRLPEKVLTQIADYIHQLEKISPDIRWVKAKNIHLTLKFLGEIQPERVEMVKSIMKKMNDKFTGFQLIISDTGCFPGRNRPRVFWLGMEHPAENPLFKIHQWIDDNLQSADFEKEKRRFSPHLTLGRVKEVGDFTKIFQYFKDNPFPRITISVETIYFIQSYLKSSGAEYNVIDSYSLKG